MNNALNELIILIMIDEVKTKLKANQAYMAIDDGYMNSQAFKDVVSFKANQGFNMYDIVNHFLALNGIYTHLDALQIDNIKRSKRGELIGE